MAEATHLLAAETEKMTNGSLLSAGEEFIRKLKTTTEPAELFATVKDALARKEFGDMLAARDERGRSALHVAATRGDLRICREIMSADPFLVNVVDKCRNTPIMDAALHGRALITKELVAHAANVTLKNADCMSALQLACVNEGAGNGDVVEELVKAGADVSDMCWQVTPLMAAADSGHSWALQTLIDLAADPWQLNSSGFSALDYARDMDSAQFLSDVMEGNKISNQAAPRFDTKKIFKDAEERRANLHRAASDVKLEDAFIELDVPLEWLPSFLAGGEHFNDIRKAWHRICLRCHPDKQPGELEDEAMAQWIAKFQNAVAAFEAVERYYRSVCKDDEFLPADIRQ
eukprot:TRINITY_DN64427_c0_g1_i1.p1 TRINITY_DN64427_c0_g1~~TRINITY_DN64427_c0_g1_i1.p1  ORF type:complete len:394 (-),score=79.82 TRINITY_DN64427_c0_g1_i1:23-1063(-)